MLVVRLQPAAQKLVCCQGEKINKTNENAYVKTQAAIESHVPLC